MDKPLSGLHALGPTAAAVRDPRRNLFAVLAAAASAALAGAALVGAFAHRAALTTLADGLPAMKVHTALALLALALAVLTFALPQWRAGAIVRGLSATLAFLVAGAALFEQLTGVDLGVHGWPLPASAAPGDEATLRPPPIAALAIACLAWAVLWQEPPGRRRLRTVRWRPLPALAAFVLGYVASVGLLLGAQWERGAWSLLGDVSLTTAACTVLLSAALTVVTPWRGTLLDAVAADTSGAQLLRSTLPAVLVLPALIVWLALTAGARGWAPPQAGPVLAAVTLAAAYLGVALYGARWINRLTGELHAHREQLEQRVAERTAELADSAERLRGSQAQLEAIVHSAGAAIVTLDADHRIVLFNAEAERVFGQRAATMHGRTLDALLPEALRASHQRHVARFARFGQTLRAMGGDVELRGLRASGEEFPLAASIARTGEGEQQLMTVVLRDLSQARALEAERSARQSAELSERAKSEFVSRVSHELRTPLNAVLGFTQLLQLTPQTLSTTQHGWITHIQTAASHLNMLVADLLEIGAADAGDRARRMDVVELPALVDDAVTMLSGQAAAAGVSVDVRIGAGATLARARLDRGRALQILTNLLSNAIKYNRPQGGVTVSLDRGAKDWRLAVRDNGIGLSPEQQAHLFEPFNRLGREDGPVEGRGLGLAVSHRLALAMGCHIEVTSRPDEGSEFALVMPQPA